MEAAIGKALDAADLFLQDEKERVAYLNREIAQMDIAAEKKYYEKQLELRHQQGLQQGQNKERLEIARNIKIEGISPDLIAKCSGLSLDEIKKI